MLKEGPDLGAKGVFTNKQEGVKKRRFNERGTIDVTEACSDEFRKAGKVASFYYYTGEDFDTRKPENRIVLHEYENEGDIKNGAGLSVTLTIDSAGGMPGGMKALEKFAEKFGMTKDALISLINKNNPNPIKEKKENKKNEEKEKIAAKQREIEKSFEGK